MNTRPFVATFVSAAAIVVAAAFPIVADAATTTAAPVSITSCTVLRASHPNLNAYNYYPYGYFYGRPFPWRFPGYDVPVTDGLSISYRVVASKPAERVAFGVDYRGQRNVVVDVGTFSPGVTIDHQFGEFSGLAYLGGTPNSCRVLAVRFKDGTVYRAPGMARRQAR